MLNSIVTSFFRSQAGRRCFCIRGRGRRERDWRLIDVIGSDYHEIGSRWPMLAGVCITWSAEVIVVGMDFARRVLFEQMREPASRNNPVVVSGGRLDRHLTKISPPPPSPTASEVLAHECGHTWQARRLGDAYLPLVGSVTCFGEGCHWWNYFENQASAEGQFGGIVNGSVSAHLMELVAAGP